MSDSELNAQNEPTENPDQAFDSLTPSESGSSVSETSNIPATRSKIAKPSSLKLSNTNSPSRISRACTQAPKPALPPMPTRTKHPLAFKVPTLLTTEEAIRMLSPRPSILKSPEFTERELNVLKNVVKHYGNIVDNPQNDLKISALQTKAWENIAKEFAIIMKTDKFSANALRDKWCDILTEPQPVEETANDPIPILETSTIPASPLIEPTEEPLRENHEQEMKKLAVEQERIKLKLLQVELCLKTEELRQKFPNHLCMHHHQN